MNDYKKAILQAEIIKEFKPITRLTSLVGNDSKLDPNELEPDKLKVIDFTKQSQITPAERRFKFRLERHLEFEGFNGAFYHQRIVVANINRSSQMTLGQAAFKELIEVIPGVEFVILRPDFMFVEHGFVVEIDGSIHDQDSLKARKDSVRASIYKLLGFDLFVIPNDDVFDAKGCKFKLDLIKKLIDERETNYNALKRGYGNRRTTLSRNRTRYLKTNSGANLGKYRPDGSKQSYEIQWGGFRIQISGKQRI